jgi:hypothetical protein
MQQHVSDHKYEQVVPGPDRWRETYNVTQTVWGANCDVKPHEWAQPQQARHRIKRCWEAVTAVQHNSGELMPGTTSAATVHVVV